MTDALVVNHDEYDRLCARVIQLVDESAWKPDWVLGVSRGGLRLADALSRGLSVPMAVVAAASYEGEGEAVRGELRLSASIAAVTPLQGQVLLVDDMVDSGVTLQKLVHVVPSMEPSVKEVRTAVLWIKPRSAFLPDYSAGTLQTDRWIVQPFERDLSAFR